MRLTYHGSGCCGIKTIRDFVFHPHNYVPKVRPSRTADKDFYTTKMSNYQQFYNKTAPQERGDERLDRYIKFVKDKRPSHLIEVVLNGDQRRNWHNCLTSRGFKVVTSFINCNTDNTCYVYHLVIKGDD